MDARFQRLFFRATSQFFQQSASTVAALSRLVTMFAEIKLPEPSHFVLLLPRSRPASTAGGDADPDMLAGMQAALATATAELMATIQDGGSPAPDSL